MQNSLDRAKRLVHLRREHAGWELLAARRAPLVISCLQSLFENNEADGVPVDMALIALGEILAEFANDSEFSGETGIEDPIREARKELNNWIRKRLIIERDDRLFATDALMKGLEFVSGLESRLFSSTSSHLTLVQRQIEETARKLNPDPGIRSADIRRQIEKLEGELERIENSGYVEVFDRNQAVEAIRETYAQAVRLRSDFRRVEDSYTEADRELRERIISSHADRGSVLDELLDKHDELIDTEEGKVFHGFFSHLRDESSVVETRNRLLDILANPSCKEALSEKQCADLRYLFRRLNSESAAVLRARERSERDVRGFIEANQASDHHRVGDLLNQLEEIALDVPWDERAVRQQTSILPVPYSDVSNVPVIERHRVRVKTEDEEAPINMDLQEGTEDDGDDAFWSAFAALNRRKLYESTLARIIELDGSASLAELSDLIDSVHDLETLTCWVEFAFEGNVLIGEEKELIDVPDSYEQDKSIRFTVPKIALTASDLEQVGIKE